jgi:DNA (cytosine-5)-methyltransferase 1
VQQYKQIGNAVPISLGRAIGRLLLAFDEGSELPIPQGFKFSRYRNTSEADFAPKAVIQKSLF